MNSLTEAVQSQNFSQDEGLPVVDELEGARTIAFVGDKGQLTVDTRRVLVALLLGPSVDARRQTKLWPILLRNEAILRSRLHDLFLDLVVDHDQQVAFTRQVVAEEVNTPILLRKMPLTFLESALLLFLRQRLTVADAQGERGVVSLQEMQEHLSVFERDDNADEARFKRQTQLAVEKLRKLSLIRLLLGGGDKRFEVAPTLKLLFPAEEIQALTRTYAGLATKPADNTLEDILEDISGGTRDEDLAPLALAPSAGDTLDPDPTLDEDDL